MTAHAKGADGLWHVLPEPVVEHDAAAECGATGPWSGVTTLPAPPAGARCGRCELAVAK